MGRMTSLASDPPWWLPPRPVWRIYLLAWLPIALVYMVAVETDGIWTRGFNLASAAHGTLRNLGPQFLLILLLWPATGWMERERFSLPRQVAVHAGLAVLVAFAYYGLLWLWIAAEAGVAAAERARANWFIWQIQIGMLAYAAAAGSFHAYRAVQRAVQQAAAAERARTLLARSELAALRNRLNPHFLFNTLHSILALVRKDPRQAEEALHGFSDMLRYLLDTERASDAPGAPEEADRVLLRDEMAFTRQYLQLEQLRLGTRLNLDWQVDDDALHLPVPALSVQPLVENSIKHAFNPTSKPGHLRVKVVRTAQGVSIEVADDGPGCTLNERGELPEGTGLGLRTVARRLALQYGDRARFALKSAPGQGFAVHLHFPAA